MVFAGLDIGSVSTKVVILNENKTVLFHQVIPTGANSKKSAEKCMHTAFEKAKIPIESITNLIATGYGRKIVPLKSSEVSEISCHARGAHFLFPDTRTVIDIGGQDSKAIRLDENGEAVDFNMNDKCAAGTGRFLEEMAKALETTVEDLGKLSLESKKALVISSMCAVFAESEVVSLLAEEEKREDIAKALHNAVVDRVLSLAHKVRVKDAVTLTGGVAKNAGVTASLKFKLPNVTLHIPEEPQIIGALGAALIAYDMSLSTEKI